MSRDSSLREFLVSRRARIDPVSVGLPPSSTPRRRSGLRREEVAALAGVSVDYYARLEQGRAGNVSDQVLTAIENALRLDPLERQHLRALLKSHAGKPQPRPAKSPTARRGLPDLVTALDPLPAMIQNRRMDVLAVNVAAKVLLADFDAMPVADRNIVRWLFLDPATRTDTRTGTTSRARPSRRSAPPATRDTPMRHWKGSSANSPRRRRSSPPGGRTTGFSSTVTAPSASFTRRSACSTCATNRWWYRNPAARP